MGESFYCKCGNRGPDGDECPHCHFMFAFANPPKSITLIFYILGGVFLGFAVGGILIAIMPSLLAVYLAMPCPIIGGYLGNKKYNRRDRS